jgi:glycosyltransferase involved in cell wall biosynthesis
MRLFPRSQHAAFLLSSLDFFVYDRVAERQVRRRLAQGERWDVVHAVTPVSPVAATCLHRLGLPLVLGPWNGGLSTPTAFAEVMCQDASWLYPLRHLGRLADFWLGATRNAAQIFTATQATRAALPRAALPRCVSMLENGVDLEVFTPAPWPAAPSATEPLHVVFIGRLVPFKGLPLLLSAIAHIRHEFPVQLTVFGDGPLAHDWRRRVTDLGLTQSVTFRGHCAAAEIAAQLQQSHVLCLPSIRESGGAVLLEAMACARPVIAVAFGGPAEIVDDSVGRTVPLTGPKEVAEALAHALRDIVHNPQAWRRRGEEGRRRAECSYGWESKINQTLAWYGQILKRRLGTPSFHPALRLQQEETSSNPHGRRLYPWMNVLGRGDPSPEPRKGERQ